MKPYGIVYRENPFAFQKSLEFWQKKYGILKITSLMRVNVVFIALIFAISLVLSLIFKNNEEFDWFLAIFSPCILSVLTVVFSYSTAKSNFVKQPSNRIRGDKKKQIILYEDKIKFGSENSVAEYSYGDVIICYEEMGIITIVLDEGSLPFSISRNDIEKGDFEIFKGILQQKLSFKFKTKGGSRIWNIFL